ncbi:MAG: acylphosphatase [Chitinophagaceae bacterium]|nr:acylphosphatase [Chitinophagaceae bacterium]
MMKTLSITVHGKVQGVFFRQSTREKALSLGLTGYVENRPDGSVFIKATGRPEQLDALVQWCHSGPPLARVTRVETQEIPLEQFEEFVIKR